MALPATRRTVLPGWQSSREKVALGMFYQILEMLTPKEAVDLGRSEGEYLCMLEREIQY